MPYGYINIHNSLFRGPIKINRTFWKNYPPWIMEVRKWNILISIVIVETQFASQCLFHHKCRWGSSFYLNHPHFSMCFELLSTKIESALSKKKKGSTHDTKPIICEGVLVLHPGLLSELHSWKRWIVCWVNVTEIPTAIHCILGRPLSMSTNIYQTSTIYSAEIQYS